MEEKLIYSVVFDGQDEVLAKMVALRKENELLKKANEQYLDVMKSNEDVADEVAKKYEQNTAQLRANNQAMTNLTKSFKDNNTVSKTAQQEFAQLKKELISMAVAGDRSSEKYKKMSARASQLQDQIGKVNAEVKAFADDSIVLNTVVDSAKALTAGFQAVKGAQAMLGIESEKFEKVITQLVGAQSLYNGLTQVANTWNKRDIIIKKAQAAWTAILAAKTAILNAVLAINPFVAIGIAVVALTAGIITLIKNFDVVIDKFKQFGRWIGLMEEVVDTTETAAQKLEKYTEALNGLLETQNKVITNTEFQIALMKAQGKGVDEIKAKERELLNEQIRAAGIRLRLAAAEIVVLGKTEEERQKTIEEVRKHRDELHKLENSLILFDAAEQTRMNEASNRRQADRNKIIDDKVKEQEEIQNILSTADAWEEERRVSELDEFDRFYDTQLKKFQQHLEDKKITQQQYDELMLELERETQLRKDEFEQEQRNVKAAADAAEAEALKEKKEGDFNTWMENELRKNLTELDLLREKAEEHKKLLADGVITQEEHDNALNILKSNAQKYREDLDRREMEIMQEKLMFEAQLAGDIIGLVADTMEAAGASFKAMKAIAVAESLINTYKAAMQAFSDPKLVAAFPANIVVAGLLTGKGLATVKKISSTPDPSISKMADGGTGMLVKGRSHSMGGIPLMRGDTGQQIAEIEGNEYFAVVNKYDAKRAALLDSINQRHGAAFNLNTSKSFFADGGLGGLKPRQDFKDSTYEIVQEVMRGVQAIRVVNVATDTYDKAVEVQNIKRNGDLN